MPASPASILARFAEVEGLSGRHADFLHGGDAVDRHRHVRRPDGSALTSIALIDGLQALLDRLGSHVTAFNTGNIILGGDGSDFMLGRGGDD